jgi:hypothetical protein
MHAFGVRLIVLVILLLGHAIINVSGHLVQPMGDVKQPDPHMMRQVYCHQYNFNKLENITEIVEQTRDITRVLHTLSLAIISLTKYVFALNIAVVVVVAMLFLK